MSKTTLTKALVAAGLCGVASLALAGGPDMPVAHQELYHGGVFLGGALSADGFTGESANMGVNALVGYNNDYMTVSLMTGATGFKDGTNSRTWLFTIAPELAYRQRIMMTNLFWKAGVGGYYNPETQKASGENNPWGVGAFAGLDYQPIRHLQASVSLYPVMYQRDQISSGSAGRESQWNIFNAGNLSLSYVF